MKIDSTHLRLVGSCPDQVGIIARVATFIADHGGNITASNQYEDVRSKTFFMRYGIELLDTEMSASEFATTFRSLADELQMDWRLTDLAQKPRIVLFVSKFDHCLAYLLHRWKGGDLRFDIPCVISNHETLRELVEWYGIPFHHVPVPKESKAKQAAFEKTGELIEQAKPDTIVLARYMQIFPAWLCRKYRHNVINIHHSFLPSFIGAKPYHQADERGVKLIGATCHYVTENLDAGPIIEQDVVRVRHSDSIEDMMRQGKDVENTVLARGLRYHLEDRVLVHGNKTILFS
ncbi:MAG: formyltetrahydrofolate deformylase [Opitutales bacterium]|jgi:formyltetrahydrofolate deformylase|nr:formyltetrahydrofolate deformylase [Opitutales bacterium]MBT5167179.1 formyltetrahydrofolate deformylase [Opitutales bacterium]MBT5812795.1 formyltetrahydrofolate deformylase [Opitutales bacterium]